MLYSGAGTVAEHLTHDPKFKGSHPVDASTGGVIDNVFSLFQLIWVLCNQNRHVPDSQEHYGSLIDII